MERCFSWAASNSQNSNTNVYLNLPQISNMKSFAVIVAGKLLTHDGARYHIETSSLICSANQWTGLYMITASAVKELTIFAKCSILHVCGSPEYASVNNMRYCYSKFVFFLWITCYIPVTFTDTNDCNWQIPFVQREKCPNTYFLVLIFLYSGWIRIFTL